ncbi:hypothetical protein [Streptomyces barkulensis]|uniref:hypothetical protein n=1 Tax=Streptomyces barkulensis TaxID=1257026 RepID=UPI000C6EF011|nr:hypothetical protein [Streptomyces barkulensis]
MLTETLVAIAAAGGTAVVQAAGTQAWEGLRDGFARLLGRGETERERVELERLDQAAGELTAAEESGGVERVRARQEAVWQTRIETLLEELPETDRETVAAEIQAVIDQAAASRSEGARAGERGLAVGGNLQVRADRHSLAGGVVNIDGDVTFGNPPRPGTESA